MCLAIPGEIISIEDEESLYRRGRVQFGTIVKDVSLCMTPEAVVGQYVLVHAGVAIGVLDRDEAERTLACFAELDAITRQEAGE
jgi:hydrogenase expression/formation protein HypC